MVPSRLVRLWWRRAGEPMYVMPGGRFELPRLSAHDLKSCSATSYDTRAKCSVPAVGGTLNFIAARSACG